MYGALLIYFDVLIGLKGCQKQNCFKSEVGSFQYRNICKYECHFVNKSEECDAIKSISNCNLREFKIFLYNATDTDFFNNRSKISGGVACFKHNGSIPKEERIEITCNEFLVGNLIRLQLSAENSQLVLCDFRIYEDCKHGFYEYGCENCSENCKEMPFKGLITCYSLNGSCVNGCKAGWEGDRCEIENTSFRITNVRAGDHIKVKMKQVFILVGTVSFFVLSATFITIWLKRN